ncbi:chorismate synthase [Candidatus Geothermarchaeota archaeon ex4572_27]|nr:MAG: chorismate synthase [Candidatus Geothermarchaeota archaeon ex4572_27]
MSSANSFGRRFSITCFGESHGEVVGVVVDGCPAGLPLTEGDVQAELDKRRPGSTPYSTSRREADRVRIVSGVFRGFTTGAPICMVVANEDVDSRPYEVFRYRPRPSHADYPAAVRYGGFNDYRGGGRFSGRMTVALVAAGAVAKKLLSRLGVEVYAHVSQVGRVAAGRQPSVEELRRVYESPVRCAVPEVRGAMEEELRRAVEEGDSVGSMVEAYAFNVPPGLGDPIYHGLDSDLAALLFSVPGVRAVCFGSGLEAPSMRGHEFIDEYRVEGGRVVAATNRSGGIIGGLSTGSPIHVRVAFKPPSTIRRRVRTVDLRSMEEVELEAYGRYDPCIGPRAVPVVEACVSIVLVDHMLNQGLIGAVLGEPGGAEEAR